MIERHELHDTAQNPAQATSEVPSGDDASSSRTRILRNISALGVGQIFTWISTAALISLLPRYLGDQNLGKFTAAVSLTDLCGLLAGLGSREVRAPL